MAKPDKHVDKSLEYLCKHETEPMTLEDIAWRCGCSKQSIHEIYNNAIKKIRKDEELSKLLDELR